MQVSQNQQALVILWYLLRHSTSALHKLIQHFGNATLAIQPNSLNTWRTLPLHKNHLERFEHYLTAQGQKDFDLVYEKLLQHCDAIITSDSEDYPQQLLPYAQHIPILMIKGDAKLLHSTQIAMVGSRNPSPHGSKIAFDFADYFSQSGYVITSGLALGIDTVAHQGSLRQGKTIAVIGTGLEQCYPQQNQALVEQILQSGGAIVSQFLPDTPPIKVNFPKRNYVIAALSLGTLVVEASLDSGSLITAKLAAEQGKQVFAIPGHISSHHHQGCHALIREGATLVDHPAQVLEDLSVFNTHFLNLNGTDSRQSNELNTSSSIIDVPPHLQSIYALLDWSGMSIDALAQQLQLNIQELNIHLTELELLGLCQQHAGRYLRLA